ncbi:MAG TPA: two-component regulator propeller domain-containing protein, partial [Cytophagales bacterium]
MRTRPPFFRLFWWLPLLAAGPFLALRAQPAAYVYLHLGQEDGLASNHVLAVLQDRQGFVWLGTGNGLQRYDGRQFVHYRHQPGNLHSLPADIVESLLEDCAGTLWVAAGGHVSRFSPQDGQFVPVPQAAPSPAAGPGRYRLALDGGGRVWWVAPNGIAGLVYDPSRRAFVPADIVESLLED